MNYNAEYYQKNKERIARRTAEYAKSRPEWRKAVARKYTLKENGWTAESYEQKLIEQGGVCDICKQKIEGVLDADHKHVLPPKPRGLLCHLCNMGIGAFKDNPERLEAAAEYLRKYGE